jgi:hypothetical protein
MPVKDMNQLKGTSPSKNIQRGIDQAWGQQNKNTTNPQQAIKSAWNKNPIKVGGSK